MEFRAGVETPPRSTTLPGYCGGRLVCFRDTRTVRIADFRRNHSQQAARDGGNGERCEAYSKRDPPNKIDDLKAALCRINVLGLTVSEVNDHGPHNWQTVAWRGHEHKLNFVPRLEVVAVVQDDDVDEVVSVIIRTARTNQRADGHVSVLPVEHRYNIHTGEREVV